jgi:DedD protein
VSQEVPAKAPAASTSAPATVAEAAKPAPAATPTPAPTPKAEAGVTKAAPEAVKPAKADNARAQAQTEDKPAKVQAADGRFVVQVGAFSDVGKAREARLRVEKAGLKTYTNVADTRDGKRIRVRVGPFGSRAEADKAASRIKELDLPASILTL